MQKFLITSGKEELIENLYNFWPNICAKYEVVNKLFAKNLGIYNWSDESFGPLNFFYSTCWRIKNKPEIYPHPSYCITFRMMITCTRHSFVQLLLVFDYYLMKSLLDMSRWFWICRKVWVGRVLIPRQPNRVVYS